MTHDSQTFSETFSNIQYPDFRPSQLWTRISLSGMKGGLPWYHVLVHQPALQLCHVPFQLTFRWRKYPENLQRQAPKLCQYGFEMISLFELTSDQSIRVGLTSYGVHVWTPNTCSSFSNKTEQPDFSWYSFSCILAMSIFAIVWTNPLK